MKVCITIPAYDEAETIGTVIEETQTALEDAGYDHEILVIDDGSTDETAAVAEAAGARVIAHTTNKGLGRTFADGLRAALGTGAEVIVNIDADGQYDPAEMPSLIDPVATGETDMTIGVRDVWSLDHMPLAKKAGNTIGTWVTSLLSGRRISDAQTGYRAMSRDLASRLTLFGTYTYVQESLIQAAYKGYEVTEIPVAFRERESGESRLISSLTEYVKNAAGIVIRTTRDYRPLTTFGLIALLFFAAAAFPAYQVLRSYLATGSFELVGRGLIVLLLGMGGALSLVFGLLADMLRSQRQVQEEVLYELRARDRP